MVIKMGELRWFGHVERKDDTGWILAMSEENLMG